jgi:glycosyltransferase involved in cell wall biosynthesis
LDSVIKQTLYDIEIICINDNSTDESPTILYEYEHIDKRIKIINFSVNQGSAIARNVAMQRSIGEWLGFVDSDDYIDPIFFEKLCKYIDISDIDIIKGITRKFEIDGRSININDRQKIEKNKFSFSSCFWSAIYRRTLIKNNKIKFLQKLPCGADLTFLIQAVTLAKKIIVVDGAFYNYVRREDSTSSSILNAEKINSILYIRNYILDYINSANMDNEGYLITFSNQIGMLSSLPAYVETNYRKSVCNQVAHDLLLIFAKCKYQKELLTFVPHYINKFLKSGNSKILAEYLQKPRVNRLADDFRARIKKKL